MTLLGAGRRLSRPELDGNLMEPLLLLLFFFFFSPQRLTNKLLSCDFKKHPEKTNGFYKPKSLGCFHFQATRTIFRPRRWRKSLQSDGTNLIQPDIFIQTCQGNEVLEGGSFALRQTDQKLTVPWWPLPKMP